jgi:hypothetical protein
VERFVRKFKLGELAQLYKKNDFYEIVQLLEQSNMPTGMQLIISNEPWYKIINTKTGICYTTNESSLIKISMPYCQIWRDACQE